MPEKVKILYVTRGIHPYEIGGMQNVSRVHIDGLCKCEADLVVVHSVPEKYGYAPVAPAKCYSIEFSSTAGAMRFSPFHYRNEIIQHSRKVHKIIEFVQPDVIYSEGPLLYYTLTFDNRCPVVFHPHGLDMFQDQRSIIRNLRIFPLRYLFSFHCYKSEKVISQGGKINNILLENIKIQKDKIFELNNSIEDLNVNRKKVKKYMSLKLLFIGRNDPKKGIPILLQAMKYLPKVTLDVIGVSRNNYIFNLSKNIIYHGSIKDKSYINQIFSKCDVLVVPSYSEGMATVILEAMSHGMPIIATDTGATCKLVISNMTGLLISSGNLEELIAAINRFYEMPENIYMELSYNCLKHIQSEFLSCDVVQKLYEFLWGLGYNYKQKKYLDKAFHKI